MKKTIAEKLVAATCIGVMAFAFVACGGKSTNSTSKDDHDGESGDGSNHVVITTVTEEQWEKAFAPDAWKNCTIEMDYSGSGTLLEQTKRIQKIDMDNGLILASFFSDAYNEAHERVAAIGNMLLVADGQRTNKYVNVGKVGEVYYLNSDGSVRVEGGIWSDVSNRLHVGFLTVEETFEATTRIFDEVADNYSEFTYDDATCSYVGVNDLTVKFENGDIVMFTYSQFVRMVVYDRGNTVIDELDDLPSKE